MCVPASSWPATESPAVGCVCQRSHPQLSNIRRAGTMLGRSGWWPGPGLPPVLATGGQAAQTVLPGLARTCAVPSVETLESVERYP